MSKHRYLLKAEILNLLEEVDDESTLVKVIKLLQESEEGETDWWDTLTDEQCEELERAEEEIKDHNNLIGHKEAMETARQFIKKDKHSDKN